MMDAASVTWCHKARVSAYHTSISRITLSNFWYLCGSCIISFRYNNNTGPVDGTGSSVPSTGRLLLSGQQYGKGHPRGRTVTVRPLRVPLGRCGWPSGGRSNSVDFFPVYIHWWVCCSPTLGTLWCAGLTGKNRPHRPATGMSAGPIELSPL